MGYTICNGGLGEGTGGLDRKNQKHNHPRMIINSLYLRPHIAHCTLEWGYRGFINKIIKHNNIYMIVNSSNRAYVETPAHIY